MGEPAIDGFPMARKPAEAGRNRPNLWARRLAAAAGCGGGRGVKLYRSLVELNKECLKHAACVEFLHFLIVSSASVRDANLKLSLSIIFAKIKSQFHSAI